MTPSDRTSPDPDAVPAGLGVRARRAAARAREEAHAWQAAGFAGARLEAVEAGSDLPAPRLRVAVGDPQAPLATLLEILDRHDLLGDDGCLHPHVFLASLGDHFDWGPVEERALAAENSVRTLTWLSAHSARQVVLLTGNHDLARVGELTGYDDARFAEAHEEATALRAIPMSAQGRAERRGAFLARHPQFPSVGVAARDWSAFEARQAALVGALLAGGRYRAAWAAAPDLLLVHGAVTRDDLEVFGLPAEAHADAIVIAEAFQEWFEDAIEAWRTAAPGTPLDLSPLYRIGSGAGGESRGIFVQRPADPGRGDPTLFLGPPRRRFDPRELPLGLAQATGHIRDAKCRELMPRWSEAGPALDGPLRHLFTDGDSVRYARGVPAPEAWVEQLSGRAAHMLFTDGGMNHVPPARYELLDLDARQALSPGDGVG